MKKELMNMLVCPVCKGKLELTVEKDFQKLFLEAVAIPHKKGPFQGLEGIVPRELLPGASG